jgi:hypothetical protein
LTAKFVTREKCYALIDPAYLLWEKNTAKEAEIRQAERSMFSLAKRSKVRAGSGKAHCLLVDQS